MMKSWSIAALWRFERLFLGVGSVVVVACSSSVGLVDSTSTGLGPGTEAIVVLGVAPENHRVVLFPGSLVNGRFRQNPFRNAVVAGTPQGGYVVGKATPGEVLAVTVVVALKNSTDTSGTRFYPCEHTKTMVFQVPAAGIYYLGDVAYELAGRQLRVIYSQDRERLRDHMRVNFPSLQGEVRTLAYQLLPTADECSRTVQVPVYIGR